MDETSFFLLECGDCLDILPTYNDHCIDLILCDLPYGTTSCPWDSIIDLEQLWFQYKRIIKPFGAVILTASQPFTTTLINSNQGWFKYEWIWVKNRPTNFAHAKNKPMKKHENILVFSEGTTIHATQSSKRMPYYPQGLVDTNDETMYKKRSSEKTDVFFQERKSHREFKRKKTGYPNSVLEFPSEQLGLHPTPKPASLMEYLVKTYSQPGEVVLDNAMGSGSTGVACIHAQRLFVGIEKDNDMFTKARNRIQTELDIFVKKKQEDNRGQK